LLQPRNIDIVKVKRRACAANVVSRHKECSQLHPLDEARWIVIHKAFNMHKAHILMTYQLGLAAVRQEAAPINGRSQRALLTVLLDKK
jgi:hypothetical protein